MPKPGRVFETDAQWFGQPRCECGAAADDKQEKIIHKVDKGGEKSCSLFRAKETGSINRYTAPSISPVSTLCFRYSLHR